MATGRRRTNGQVTTLLPADGNAEKAPRSPYKLGPAARKWWRWAWKTPQSTAWDDGSLAVVGRRAVLEDAFAVLVDPDAETPPSARALSELAVQMHRLDEALGLTPRAMRSLGWVIADAMSDDETTAMEVTELDDLIDDLDPGT